MTDDSDLDKKLASWTDRMADKDREEQEQDAQRTEKLRQDYLKRTGRTEVKP